KEEVRLVFGTINATQKLETSRLLITADARIMACSNALRADLPRRGKELGKLDLGVAEAARNGSLAGQVAFHEGPHHSRFKLLFQIDNVVGDVQKIGHGARIVNVIERTAAPTGTAT